MESAVGWGYERYGAKAKDGNEPERSGGVASWGERLTRISMKITEVKRVGLVVVVLVTLIKLSLP